MRLWKPLFLLGLAAVAFGGNPPSAAQSPPPALKQNAAAGEVGVTRRDLEHVQQKLTNALAAQKNDFDRRLFPLDHWKSILGGFFGWNLLAIAFAVWGVGKKHMDRVEKRLAVTADRKLSLINDHLNALDHEREVKQQWRILILANPGDSSALDLLQGLGFKSLALKELPAQPALDKLAFAAFGERRFNLVVFDQLDEDRIDGYLAFSQKQVFVAYSPKPMRVNVAVQAKINFANSPMTLLNRIIEATRYQNSLSRCLAKKRRG